MPTAPRFAADGGWIDAMIAKRRNRFSRMVRGALVFLLALAGLAAPALAHDIRSFNLPDGTRIDYVLVLPDGYDETQKYEALLAFPGGSQTIESAESTVERFWEPEAVKRGVIVVVPAAPSIGRPYYLGEGSVNLIPDIVAAMRAAYPIKDGKIHLGGHSNGGVTAFRAAIRWPELFQTLTVIAGVPAEQVDFDRIDRLRGMKISMFVGSSDVDWRMAMVETKDALGALGIDATLRIVPQSSHLLEALSFAKSGPLFDTVVPAPAGAQALPQ
jgi:poly(3-hydroxybutyrate) depolymerase